MKKRMRIFRKLFITLLTLILILSSISMPVLGADSSKVVVFPWKFPKGEKYIPSANFGELTYSHMNEAMWQWNKDAGAFGGIVYIVSLSNSRHNNDYNEYSGFCKSLSIIDQTFSVYREARTDVKFKDFVGYCNVIAGEEVTDADILINVSYKFANSAKAGCYDTWSIFIHEIGHALGIAHPADSSVSAVMQIPAPIGKERRYLYEYDLKGIKGKLYGL